MKKTGILGLALLLLCPTLFAAPKEKKENTRKEIGLQLYSVRSEIKKDLAITLDSVAQAGYTIVETAGYADGKFYGMEPLAFKKMCESRGLQFLSSHLNQHINDNSSWEPQMQWWDTAIAAHRAAGVKYMIMPSMSKYAFESLAGLKRYCEYFNEVGKKVKAAGMEFGFHNHAKEFSSIEGEVIYDFMLRNTRPEYVFFQIDLYWIMKGGANVHDYFKKYPGRFPIWHVKDEKEIGASGKMDFKSIFQEAKRAGMHYMIVEQEDFDYPIFQSIRKSYQFLEQAPFVKTTYAK